jgi:hypothetical protein
MAELLCGAIPGISGTVAARHRRINDGDRSIGARIPARRRIFSCATLLIDPDREQNKNYIGAIRSSAIDGRDLLGPANHLQKAGKTRRAE